MIKTNIVIKLLLVFWFAIQTMAAQEKVKQLKFPENPIKAKVFLQAINTKKEDYERFLTDSEREEIKSHSINYILDKIDYEKKFGYLFDAEYWILFNYKEAIPELIYRVTDKKEVGLTDSADLIIFERIDNGDMEFYGQGEIVADDLFIVAGRANWLLCMITGENFGSVTMYSTDEELKNLQQHWINWLNTLE